jgi:hypothetical protein
MIERRRLFFRSDFLRDITRPALFRELLCNLYVYYQETRDARLPKQTVIPTASTKPNSHPNWPYRNSLTGSFFFYIRVLAMENSIKEATSIMKPKQISNSVLAVLFVFPLMGTFAQQAPNSVSIEVIATFDYPGIGNLTEPQQINERGDVVGIFLDSNRVSRAFIRFSDGSFSDPIVDPNDTVGVTEGRGINNSGTFCGDYVGSDGNFHGFFLSAGTFTEYDINGAPAPSTLVLGINDSATFAGAFSLTGPNGTHQGFVSVGGTITSFGVPGANSTFAYKINNSNQLVGYYIDSSGIVHGYYRDANGALHFRSTLPAPLEQSCLGLAIETGRWADMGTAQARLMDSSLSRQTTSPLSTIPGQPLHRLTESTLRGLSVVVTSMLPALPTDSWLASEAHRRQKRRGRK